jgi:hypothetical protein
MRRRKALPYERMPRPHCPSKKVRHGSRAEAELAYAGMVAGGRVRDGELKVYKCDLCKGFHLGHRISWRLRWEKAAT